MASVYVVDVSSGWLAVSRIFARPAPGPGTLRYGHLLDFDDADDDDTDDDDEDEDEVTDDDDTDDFRRDEFDDEYSLSVVMYLGIFGFSGTGSGKYAASRFAGVGRAVSAAALVLGATLGYTGMFSARSAAPRSPGTAYSRLPAERCSSGVGSGLGLSVCTGAGVPAALGFSGYTGGAVSVVAATVPRTSAAALRSPGLPCACFRDAAAAAPALCSSRFSCDWYTVYPIAGTTSTPHAVPRNITKLLWVAMCAIRVSIITIIMTTIHLIIILFAYLCDSCILYYPYKN